jgi:hypothetical protein
VRGLLAVTEKFNVQLPRWKSLAGLIIIASGRKSWAIVEDIVA